MSKLLLFLYLFSHLLLAKVWLFSFLCSKSLSCEHLNETFASNKHLNHFICSFYLHFMWKRLKCGNIVYYMWKHFMIRTAKYGNTDYYTSLCVNCLLQILFSLLSETRMLYGQLKLIFAELRNAHLKWKLKR